MASPKFGSWWILRFVFIRGSSVHQRCSSYALTNLLFGLCKSMWVIDLLVNLPSCILELRHALLPPKCHELGSTPQLLLLSLFSSLDLQLSPSRSLGVRHKWWLNLFKRLTSCVHDFNEGKMFKTKTKPNQSIGWGGTTHGYVWPIELSPRQSCLSY